MFFIEPLRGRGHSRWLFRRRPALQAKQGRQPASLPCAETGHEPVPGACRVAACDLAGAEVRAGLELAPAADGGCRKIATPGRLFVTALQGRGEADGGVPRTAPLGALRDDRARWQATPLVSRSHRQIIFRQPRREPTVWGWERDRWRPVVLVLQGDNAETYERCSRNPRRSRRVHSVALGLTRSGRGAG